jgi:hypothetical protein
MICSRIVFAGAATILTVLAAIGDRIPPLKGTTLSGAAIAIPVPQARALILSIGFSHSSDKPIEAWDKRIAAAYASESRVTYYELPVIEGAPGMIRPMILRSMRKSVPKPEQARMAPLVEGEKSLKRITGFQEPDAAYVLVASGDGKIVWLSHAPVSDSEFAALRQAVAGLLK